jgi:hypothetical protein
VRSAEAIHLGDFSEGKTPPVEESTDQFRSWEEASQAGKKALEEIISKSCRTPTV